MMSNQTFTQEIEMAKGTVVLRVPELLKERNLTTQEMMWGARLSQGTAYHLARGEAERISFEILASLCAFFDVQPGELLQFIPEDKTGA
jgi:DNA-binding Xre family transcriptional regulator